MEEMKRLVKLLNDATTAYDAGHPIMSDAEWDRNYFSLLTMERELGYAEPDSPSQRVIFKTVSKLKKVTHNHPMLSLDKTKSIDEVLSFAGSRKVIAMCKMDGLTCSLHYVDGCLISAETRGNGVEGEDILHNARVLSSIPQKVAFKAPLTVDGEIICTYTDFAQFAADYKNPRNFAAGSIRLLNSGDCFNRHLTFIAWDTIGKLEYQNMTCVNLSDKLDILKTLGFITVPYVSMVGNVENCIDYLVEQAKKLSYPIDGIVFKYNNCEYYESLGATEHHFRGGLAYKLYDEQYDTTLQNIEWTMGRTGILTPVAIYDDVEIDGAICNRASLHNISIMKELLNKPYQGQPIKVYKANQIIPQIAKCEVTFEETLSPHKYLTIPTSCPICGMATIIRKDNDSEVLYCTNEDCEGKLINKLDHFCGKKGLDIKGLSKAILGKLIDCGWVDSFSSIFKLRDHATEWKKMPNFGEKSVNNILAAVDAASNPTLDQLLSAIGIPLIGRTYAKKLAEIFADYNEFRDAVDGGYDFSTIAGFGYQMNDAIVNFNYQSADELINNGFITIRTKETKEEEPSLANLTFVITGKLIHYKNRDLLKEIIENKGGKVTGSVTSKTSFLINNDINSTSSKNETAKRLGVPIITEEEFLKKYHI